MEEEVRVGGRVLGLPVGLPPTGRTSLSGETWGLNQAPHIV